MNRRMRAPPPTAYDQIEASAVPDGLKWRKRCGYHKNPTYETLFTMADTYKLMRVRDTGAVKYFRLRDTVVPTPPEVIDFEPKRKLKETFSTGSQCWFVNEQRWFLVEVVRHTRRAVVSWESIPRRIVIRSVTGWDDTRQTPWAYGEELEIIARENGLYRRLRKLSARQR